MPNNLVLPKGLVGGSRGRSQSASGVAAGGGGSGASSLGTPSFSPSSALAVLSLGKLSRVASAFVSYAYLQSAVALPLYLFFVTLGAAVCLVALQRPWNGRRIGTKRAKKVMLAGTITALMLYVWSAGLRSAGPLRALLLDGAEIPLLYVFAVVTGRELPEKKKTRGAVLMIAAYALLVWDASGRAPNMAQLEHSKLARSAEETLGRFGNMTSEKLHNLAHAAHIPEVALPRAGGGLHARKLLSLDSDTLGKHPRVPASGSVWDAFVEGTPLRSELGVLLVLASSVILQASRPFTRRLSAELGGAKRHFALSVTAASICLSPLALLSYFSSATGAFLSMSVIGGATRVPLNTYHTLGFALVGFLWLVLPYYVRAIVSTSMDQRTALQAGVVVPFILAAGASLVFGLGSNAGGLTWIVVVAFLLDAAGLSIMVSGGGAKRALSELPLDSRSSVSTGNGSSSRTSRGE
jgi:hypothetical protein